MTRAVILNNRSNQRHSASRRLRITRPLNKLINLLTILLLPNLLIPIITVQQSSKANLLFNTLFKRQIRGRETSFAKQFVL